MPHPSNPAILVSASLFPMAGRFTRGQHWTTMSDSDDINGIRAVLNDEMTDALAAIQAKDFSAATALLERAAQKLKAIADDHDCTYPNETADG